MTDMQAFRRCWTNNLYNTAGEHLCTCLCRESPAFVDVAEAEDTTATPQVNSAANLQQTSLRREEDDTSSLILALLGPSHRNDIVIVRPGTNDYDSGSNTTSGHTTRTTEELAGLPTASVRSFHDEAFDTQHRCAGMPRSSMDSSKYCLGIVCDSTARRMLLLHGASCTSVLSPDTAYCKLHMLWSHIMLFWRCLTPNLVIGLLSPEMQVSTGPCQPCPHA